MKTYLFPILAMLLCVFSGCSHRPDTKPLSGATGLATFTIPSDDGKTLLTGVKRLQTEEVIVPPAVYTDIKGDSCVITCTRADKSITAYTADGRKIGNFELFTPWNGTYCLGVRYVNKTYYFPTTGEIITTRHSLHEPELLFIRTDSGWDVRTYKGELKSKIEADSLWIIRDAQIPTKILIGTIDSLTAGSALHTDNGSRRTAGCSLCTPDGKPYKTLPPRQWQSLKSKLQNQQVKAETITTANITEFDEI